MTITSTRDTTPSALDSHSPTHAGPPPRRMRKLVVHYVEMVLAMFVGMMLLHPLWSFTLDAIGWSGVLDLPEPMALVMATNMTIGMSIWMRYRGHGWRSVTEMAAAMYLPFIVLFVPLWADALSQEGMFLWGHVLMLFTMAGAMALRPHEYAHC